MYFDKNRGKIADFSILIELLNQLSKFEYKDRIRSNITIKIIKILKDVKEIGNLSVHEVLRKITKSFAAEIQDEIDLALEALLVSYKKLNDAHIEIESERLVIIEKKIGLRKKDKIEKNVANKQSLEISNIKKYAFLKRLINLLRNYDCIKSLSFFIHILIIYFSKESILIIFFLIFL